MKNNLTNTFNFNGMQLRTFFINDELYFVGTEVARILGYSNAGKAVMEHVDDEDKTKEFVPHSQNGNAGSYTFLINESGLYSLILSSKLPQAKEFKRWVTNDVLPTIRRNGSYNGERDALPKTPQEITKQLLSNLDANNEDIKSLKHDVGNLKDNMRITGSQEKALLDIHHNSAFKALGGKESNAYLDRKVRDKTFRAEWHEFKQMFHLPRYGELQQVRFEDGMKFLKMWQPNTELRFEIEDLNDQTNLDI